MNPLGSDLFHSYGSVTSFKVKDYVYARALWASLLDTRETFLPVVIVTVVSIFLGWLWRSEFVKEVFWLVVGSVGLALIGLYFFWSSLVNAIVNQRSPEDTRVYADTLWLYLVKTDEELRQLRLTMRDKP